MCASMQPGWVESKRHKVQDREGMRVKVKGSKENSSHVAFHRYHNPGLRHISSVLFRFILPFFPLLSLSVSSSCSSLGALGPSIAPMSQTLKPSWGKGRKSVSPSQEISWGSANSTKAGQYGGPNVARAHTQARTHAMCVYHNVLALQS